MRKVLKTSKCEIKGCRRKGKEIVYSRDRGKVLICCESCADEVEEEGGPEYTHTCENCGCRCGIN